MGRGSTLEVYLPRTEAAVGAKPERAEKGEAHGRGERVLVVEDEPGMRDIVREILESLGYRAWVAANGGEALLAVEEGRFQPDLLMTDVVMPGMSGIVLAERLRRSQPDLKVLFMSGYTDDGVVHNGVLEPRTPFIQKPFWIGDLAAKLEQLLGGQDAGPPSRAR